MSNGNDQNALELHGLTKSYGDFTLDHVDLTLPKGCIIGLVGENGAGKSTTIKLILDIISKDSGSITVLGKTDSERTAQIRQDIGVVLEEPGLFPALNAIQAGRIYAGIFSNWNSDKYTSLLKNLDVPTDKKFSDMSKGTKMKLGIALALSHDPKLLLLDEATSGLDPVVRDDLLDIFMDFTREEDHAILMSSHIVSDLEKACDYIAFLHKGKLILMEEKDRIPELFGIVHGTAQELSDLGKDTVLRIREGSYGAEALVRRNEAPQDIDISPVGLEDLFIFLVKGRQL